MDKLGRLQALTGNQDIVSQIMNGDDGWGEPRREHYVKPLHLYEGTDSDDDEFITSEGRSKTRGQPKIDSQPRVQESGRFKGGFGDMAGTTDALSEVVYTES